MNTTRDNLTGASLPSGSEVESARLHVPVSVDGPAPDYAQKGRIDEVKSKVLMRVHDVQRKLGDKTSSLRGQARYRMTRLQNSMRTSPAKWAGVAAGAGLALGLIGRFADARRRYRPVAELVIIEAHC
ncbi:MAG TPA: hypothetical protein VF701_21005 [Thermoanaerobaculia bacterium]